MTRIKKMFSFFYKCLVLSLPWPVRRLLLEWSYGYSIDPTARIQWSWIFPRELRMGAHSHIGPFTVAIHLDRMYVADYSTIGRKNWITGFPTDAASCHFEHKADRQAELVIGEHSAITKNHHLDCTDRIEIGRFVTIAGYYSQFLTHSIDLHAGRQDCAPITIGDYCFVGTNVVVLGGSVLPASSVLGAKSLLNKAFSDPHFLYGGVPAKPIQPVPADWAYFQRDKGFVY